MERFQHIFSAFASRNEVIIYDQSADRAASSFKLVEDEAKRIEAKYSRYRNDSIIYEINNSAGIKKVSVDTETAQLLNYADACYKQSGGLFDITSGVLRRIWNFKEPRIPTEQERETICSHIGWNRVERSQDSIYLPQGMELDFGGFGKEYAVDQATMILEKNGIQAASINFGGDLRVIGSPPGRDSWIFGIAHPRIADQIIASLEIKKGALATSGDYERFFELDGKRFCHILNPRTGLPVTNFQSVSVIAPAALIAGSCTTIAMLLEKPKAIKFLQTMDYPFLIVDQEGKMKVDKISLG